MKSKPLNLTLTLNPSGCGEIKSKITIKIMSAVVRLLLLGAMLGCSILSALAQPQPPPPNPAAIMLSPQPNIDTTTPVVAKAEFDPPLMRPDGTSTYRVSFNALMASVEWPEDVIAPSQLELTAGARGETFSQSGLGMQPHTGYNYRIHATKTGSFTVPRFTVYVYGKPVTVPAATLEVATNPTIPVAPGRRLLLEAVNPNPFVGQSISLRIVLPGSTGNVQPLNQIKFIGDGFMTDQSGVQQRMDIFPEYGTNSSSLVCEASITPLKAGKLELFAQGFTANLNAIGPITIRGTITLASMGQPPVLLDSDRITVNARPLPRENVPPGFNGAIGNFRLDPPVLATNVLHVGDPLTFAVNVRGEGNLARLVAPPPPTAAGWQVFAGPTDPAPPMLIQARGFVTFAYSMIPTLDGARATPKIPFSYFDPDKAAYMDLSLPPVNVTVLPSATPLDVVALASTNEPAFRGEKEPKLSGLAANPGRTMTNMIPVQQQGWFPLVQLSPVVVFVTLWGWDRRRRFHEAHPEVLLRRRARRALHREWAAARKAAALGDTSRFAACAVSAMRVACAPHYPAEPRALVSSDVVPLLPEFESNGGKVVRQIFAAADAERFAEQPEPAKDLLALRGDVDRVLTQLEAKL